MKKIILGIVTTLVVLAMSITNVNAASLNAVKEAKVGDTVAVTVDLENESRSIGLTLSYDTSKFEYVSTDVEDLTSDVIVNTQKAGEITIAGHNVSKKAKKVTFTFKALAVTDESTKDFTVTGDLVTESDETLKNTTVKVDVVEPEDKKDDEDKGEDKNDPQGNPSEGENKPAEENKGDENNKPAEENKGDENNKPAEENKSGDKVDTNGNKIKALPKTGIQYVTIGLVAVAVVVAIVAIKKIRK